MKYFYLLLLCFAPLFQSCSNSNEQHDRLEIMEILKNQEKSWNTYDIESFMQGYWKSDSLKFYGANGITLGWQNTLDNYHNRYPSKEHTGTLSFKINDISKINDKSYFVLGAYHLERSVGNADGGFMIVLKKINGEWKIIADTSFAN